VDMVWDVAEVVQAPGASSGTYSAVASMPVTSVSG
jgi:hypothetical protein